MVFVLYLLFNFNGSLFVDNIQNVMLYYIDSTKRYLFDPFPYRIHVYITLRRITLFQFQETL